MSDDVFSDYRSRYEKAVREKNIAVTDAILKRWAWFASRPWVHNVPDWVRALGVTPGSVVSPRAPSPGPPTWAALAALFRSPITGTNPTTRSPKAWSAVDAQIGGSAYLLIASASLSTVQQQLAVNVVYPLVLAADAIESSLAPSATETAAHVVWRSDLAAVNALVADIDGGSSTGATAYELGQRLAIARSNLNLAPGKAALAQAISVPAEPALDRALISAAEAVRLFFT